MTAPGSLAFCAAGGPAGAEPDAVPPFGAPPRPSRYDLGRAVLAECQTGTDWEPPRRCCFPRRQRARDKAHRFYRVAARPRRGGSRSRFAPGLAAVVIRTMTPCVLVRA